MKLTNTRKDSEIAARYERFFEAAHRTEALRSTNSGSNSGSGLLGFDTTVLALAV
jgi:hypothetical protein